MSLLSCREVSFGYEGNTVVENITFEIHKGDYLCILGENGTGKSTLMKGLLSLKKPFAGQIITGDGFEADKIGYLPQQTQVQKDFPASVREVVLSGRLNRLKKRFFYGKEDKRAAEKSMERLGIAALKKKCYRELSGGQQQRVLLARALCATENLLLLDEPVTGLDPLMAKEMYGLVKKLNKEQGITVIMVSHDLKGILDQATHVLQLKNDGYFYGTTEEYLASEEGKRFTGGEEL